MKYATILRLTILLLLLLVLGPSSTAEDPAPATTEGAGGSSGAARGDEPLDTFVPTEKLPADSAIAFPVDI